MVVDTEQPRYPYLPTLGIMCHEGYLGVSTTSPCNSIPATYGSYLPVPTTLVSLSVTGRWYTRYMDQEIPHTPLHQYVGEWVFTGIFL